MNHPNQTSIPPGESDRTEASPLEEMVSFFKALADPNRLKILGLLAREPLSVEQIAEMVGLRASTWCTKGWSAPSRKVTITSTGWSQRRWKQWPTGCYPPTSCPRPPLK